MPTSLSLPVLSPTKGTGEPTAISTGTATPSALVGAVTGPQLALSLPVLSLTQGPNDLAPIISSLLEVIISGGNCPPIWRYPATGQRGSRAWTLS
jgi:hypothetical protein